MNKVKTSSNNETKLQRIKRRKREAIEYCINNVLELFKDAKDLGTELAKQTLEDIQLGENPDLERVFRVKIKELGIRLDN